MYTTAALLLLCVPYIVVATFIVGIVIWWHWPFAAYFLPSLGASMGHATRMQPPGERSTLSVVGKVYYDTRSW